MTHARRSSLQVLPMAHDDWTNGHDWPDLVEGIPFGELIALHVRYRGRKRWLRRVFLTVSGDSGIFEPTAGPRMTLVRGQSAPLHAPLRLQSGRRLRDNECPVPVSLTVVAAPKAGPGKGKILIKHSAMLRCRRVDESVTFLYLDFDQSPQVAAVRLPPALKPKHNPTLSLSLCLCLCLCLSITRP